MKQKLFIILSIIVSIMILVSCQNKQASTAKVEIKQITVTELEEMLDEAQTDRLYIDVREIDEYAAGHIEEFINYPLSTLKETMEQLPKDKEIVIICRSGNRSMQAASMLIDAGFPVVTNVQGAMLEWKRDVVVGEK